MGPGGELWLGMGDIVISGIKQNCTVTIMKCLEKTVLHNEANHKYLSVMK